MKTEKYRAPKEIRQAIKLLQLAFKAESKDRCSYFLYNATDKLATAKRRL